MISKGTYNEAYVWIWLPAKTEPVVAGLLSASANQLVFNYGRSYLQRSDAIPIYTPELPLQQGVIPLLPSLDMPSCIRDASPDAWGRRVLINRKLGLKGNSATGVELDELTYLLESGSDRIGALDFQRSPTEYIPRQAQSASLEALMQSAERVEKGIPLQPELDQALQHGTSLGGARPKVLIEDGERKFIAKFSATNDLYNIVKAEFIAMRLAAEVGLDVAPVKLTTALGKDVLLIERFDRIKVKAGWQRKAMVSALTLFELNEMMAAYASYETLAEIIRHRFTEPMQTLEELFGRMVFNILCGNTDDHARNHAAFWDGKALTLTSAYDICPQSRSGNEASQAMLIHGNHRMSQLITCLDAAPNFLLTIDKAKAIITRQIHIIKQRFQTVCDEASLPEVDRRLLWRRQFLNPFAFYGAPDELTSMQDN
ncbi:type II toxin-antitoxin system HipA family toxin [Cellvibrio sp. ARAG 10.3]|uniref:type II toxin-antitoxin system HipA family toxin n=1 Tax=Cellvibrio sp. ARAG 10.3 TaxID=3451358 RepID=UPI003F452205